MRSRAPTSVVVLLVLLVGGCSEKSQPVATPPDGSFSLSDTAVSFGAFRMGSIPPSATVAVSVTGADAAYVAAGFEPYQAQPGWLRMEVVEAAGAHQIVVSVLTTDLPPGRYSETFVVATSSATLEVLDTAPVTVTYDVTEKVALERAPYAPTFVIGEARLDDSVPVTVRAAGRTWTASTDASWLQVPTGPNGGDATIVAVVDASSLAPGPYVGHLTVANVADPLDTASLEFVIEVEEPTLTVAPSSIVLGGADGLSLVPGSLTLALGTGTATHPYTVVPSTDSAEPWLEVTPANGAVGAAGTTLTIDANRSLVRGGTHAGSLRVTFTVGDRQYVRDVPVTWKVEASRLVVDAPGVGFSASPAGAVLARDVVVRSSIGRTDVPWEAASDQAWLQVGSSGTTGGAVSLVADPTGLAMDVTHHAVVTVTSPDATVENVETIRVGLHVSSLEPITGSVQETASHLVASPVEPVVFLANGGTSVTARDVNTGAVVRTLAGVSAAAGSMAVSGDGTRLFVYDKTNLRVTEVDAVTGAIVRQHSSVSVSSSSVVGGGIAYVRPAGRPTLITPSSRMFDLETGAELSTRFAGAPGAYGLSATSDGALLATDGGGVYSVAWTALDGGRWAASYLFSTGTAGGRAGQACVSPDRTMIYTASGWPYNFPGTSVVTRTVAQVLPGTNYPNAIVCAWNGLVVGGVDGYYAESDIFAYDGPSGVQVALLSSASSTGYRSLVDRGLAVSADGTRLISLSEPSSGAAEVRFQAIPTGP